MNNDEFERIGRRIMVEGGTIDWPAILAFGRAVRDATLEDAARQVERSQGREEAAHRIRSLKT